MGQMFTLTFHWSEVRSFVDPLFRGRDVLCGKLFCHGGNVSPNYGRMVTVRNCKGTFYDDPTKDYGQVDTGTKCEDGKVTGSLISLLSKTSPQV